jgi:hypothetical protein
VDPGAAVGPGHEPELPAPDRRGVGAVSWTAPFWITVMVNGALAVVAPAVSWRPLLLVAMVRFTVLGWRVTLVVAVMPPESVAVSCSSR